MDTTLDFDGVVDDWIEIAIIGVMEESKKPSWTGGSKWTSSTFELKEPTSLWAWRGFGQFLFMLKFIILLNDSEEFQFRVGTVSKGN